MGSSILSKVCNTSILSVGLSCAITILSAGYRPLGSCSRAAGWRAATLCSGPKLRIRRSALTAVCGGRSRHCAVAKPALMTESERCSDQIYQPGRTGPLCEASSDRLYIASQAIVARFCGRTSDYVIVQRYTGANLILALRARRPKLQQSQDGRNAVCLRRAER